MRRTNERFRERALRPSPPKKRVTSEEEKAASTDRPRTAPQPPNRERKSLCRSLSVVRHLTQVPLEKRGTTTSGVRERTRAVVLSWTQIRAIRLSRCGIVEDKQRREREEAFEDAASARPQKVPLSSAGLLFFFFWSLSKRGVENSVSIIIHPVRLSSPPVALFCVLFCLRRAGPWPL